MRLNGGLWKVGHSCLAGNEEPVPGGMWGVEGGGHTVVEQMLRLTSVESGTGCQWKARHQLVQYLWQDDVYGMTTVTP
jgi:hypothetical protein